MWYNTRIYHSNTPIFYYTNLQKSGSGYSSGEYDINDNGSLIIHNVSITHDGTFTAIRFQSKQEKTVPNYIRVIVTGKSQWKLIKCLSRNYCPIRIR